MNLVIFPSPAIPNSRTQMYIFIILFVAVGEITKIVFHDMINFISW